MPNDEENLEFPEEIQAAFKSYPRVQTSPAFEAHFWSNLDARRGRYHGFSGFLRLLWELEIEGVAVWRLALSTLSGGAACALVFGAFALSAMPRGAPVEAEKVALRPVDPFPGDSLPDTPRMAFEMRHFYAREWESREWESEVAPPKSVPQREKSKSGGEISWNGSKHGWA